MKIVVNRCFGGFNLSPEAIKMYLNLLGKEAYFYKDVPSQDFKNMKFIRIDTKQAEEVMCFHTATRDFGEIATNNDINSNYFNERDLPRNDENLIKVVETLGEKATGKYAELEIVEIPDGVEWEIDEYDGSETICEKHRKW